MQRENYKKKTKVFEAIMKEFKPYEGFQVEDYYGVSLLSIKRNGKFNIKLVYDYDKRSLTSNAVEIETMEKATKILLILDYFKKDKTDKPKSIEAIDLDVEDYTEKELEW